MALSAISSGTSIYNSSAITDQISQATSKPLERLSKEADSTKVQLSAYGQVKSATAQVDAAASKLQDNKNLGSATDASKAAQNFADAINGQLKAGKQAALPVGSSRVSSETHRAVEGLAGKDRQALNGIGITFAQDGSMKVDSKALEKAYQSDPNQVKDVLNRVGKAAEDVSTKQLSSTGSVGGAIGKLETKLGNIEQKQADYQSRLNQYQSQQEEAQRLDQVQQQAFSFNGVGAYGRIFSF